MLPCFSFMRTFLLSNKLTTMPSNLSFSAVLAITLYLFLPEGAAAEDRSGRWITGDLHVHTALSADARTHLDDAVHKAFDDFHLDYMAVSNHLRNNSGNNVDDKSIKQLFSKSLKDYEWPAILSLGTTYSDKLLMSTFEWDMPTHDHMNIGLLTGNNTEKKLTTTAYFEYRFGAKNAKSDFSPEQLEAFSNMQVPRQNTTHQDGVKALEWLQHNYAGSGYAMLNHPTRYASSYNLDDIREFNDVAPDVFFLVEGMVGNQFNGYRGDYDNNSRAGLWGGSDPFTAEVGGNWDALLAEGRRIWLVTNSDHHFKAIKPYSSGYFPGEYSKTYVYLQNEPLNQQHWLAAMRSGNSFSVFGDLINGMDFSVSDANGQATMGQILNVRNGESITINLTVTQPRHNNREKVVGNAVYDGQVPPLHHIDVIAGDILENTDSQGSATAADATTEIVKTFTSNDWTVNDDGSYSMSFTMNAAKSQFFRLRGTGLRRNQKGFTRDGEPVRSALIERGESFTPAYYETINQRNYTDTWFYSNPVFVSVVDDSDTTERGKMR